MDEFNPFTLELLQAINDWQISSNSKRGHNLDKLSKNLPSWFKEVKAPCYRKINLEKGGVFSLFGRNYLREKISSWSTSIDLVKKFKGSVSKRHMIEQSIILSIAPSHDDIVINLDRVYGSACFHTAVSYYKSQIKNFDKGISKYGNSQNEIVLHIDSVTSENVFMLGGRSSGFCVSASSILIQEKDCEFIYDIEYNKIYVFKWINPSKTKLVKERVLHNKIYPYNVYAKRFGL